MLFSYSPLAGMYEAHEIAAMAAVLEEICAECAAVHSIPRDEILNDVGEMIIEIQSRQRLLPEQLKTAVIARLEAKARRLR